ncbi:hypothetical protein ASD36_18110 [Rhizobium sp. Root1334]|nr:hypothetical protein ASD36_18110 [Rhizobium sp. Root1334]
MAPSFSRLPLKAKRRSICALQRSKRQENGHGWRIAQGFGKTMAVEGENAPRHSPADNGKRAGKSQPLQSQPDGAAD